MKNPANGELEEYFQEHRFTVSSVYEGIRKHDYVPWGVYAHGSLKGLVAYKEDWKSIRFHGGSVLGASLFLDTLKEGGEYRIFDSPSHFAGQFMGQGKLNIEEPAIMHQYSGTSALEQKFSGKIRPLRPEHAEMVHNRWGINEDEEMVDFFRKRIKSGMTSAIYDDGTPVAWGGTYHETPWVIQLGWLYVEEEHRRQGFGTAITVDLVNRVLDKGKTPMLHVFETNDASLSLVKKYGFVQLERRFWGTLLV